MTRLVAIKSRRRRPRPRRSRIGLRSSRTVALCRTVADSTRFRPAFCRRFFHFLQVQISLGLGGRHDIVHGCVVVLLATASIEHGIQQDEQGGSEGRDGGRSQNLLVGITLDLVDSNIVVELVHDLLLKVFDPKGGFFDQGARTNAGLDQNETEKRAMPLAVDMLNGPLPW
jgi:hypothetical protein